jgi:thiamine kinase-like enzyme
VSSRTDASLPVEVASVLDDLPGIGRRPRTVEPLPGGLTNRNYKVTTPDGCSVVRLSSKDSELLAIDREAEYRNSLAAASVGAAPAVVDYLPDKGVLVVSWVQGRTLQPEDLRDSRMLAKVAAACRLLHSGPRFVNGFDMFRIQRSYLDIVASRGFRLPPRYLEFLPAVERIRTALAARDEGTVPCNNDLLAANFIAEDDTQRLWLIDYEYSGNNDACFELGNVWSEANLSLEQLEELVTAYYGRTLRHKVARARLLGLMSKYGWTLWASIQDATSTLDFDFWSWGMEKYERAIEEFDGPGFDGLLEEATRAD